MDWTTLPSSNNKIDFKIDIEGMKPGLREVISPSTALRQCCLQ